MVVPEPFLADYVEPARGITNIAGVVAPGIDFTDPEMIVMCARTGLADGAVSWFYVSRDRARTWQGPVPLRTRGQLRATVSYEESRG